MNQLEQQLSKSWYSQVVETGNQPVFEFFRNQSFFGQVMQRPGLQVSMRHPRFTHTKKEKVIVLAPGASTEERRWPAEQFAALLNFLFEQSPEFSFVLIGSAAEAGLCRKIKALCGMDLEVLAGITGLRESMQILADSSLLIANESGPVHMAATTGTPCVCISNGNHFGRWNPYPPEIAENILTCYPDSFYPLDKNYSRLLAAYHDRSELPASEVSFERVYSACLSLLGLSGD
jgi:ADP-heptose:LPS heptosyltransferase